MGIEQRVEQARQRYERAKAVLKRLEAKQREVARKAVCRGCGAATQSKARPRVWCDECKGSEVYRAWVRKTYGGAVARVYQREYKRRYREKLKQAAQAAKDAVHNPTTN